MYALHNEAGEEDSPICFQDDSLISGRRLGHTDMANLYPKEKGKVSPTSSAACLFPSSSSSSSGNSSPKNKEKRTSSPAS